MLFILGKISRASCGLPGQGGLEQPRRVLRGGSWNNTNDNARAAYRNNNTPDNRNNNNGIRVVVAAHVLLSLLRLVLLSACWREAFPT